MQRAFRSFALLFIVLNAAACMDQARQDGAVSAMEAARHEAAREGRLQALEREHAFLMQQIMTLSAATNVSQAQASVKEGDLDKRLADVSEQVGHVARMLSAWRDEERPQAIDPESRRVAEQTSAEDRVAAIRKVQALIDAGQIKLLMRGGRIQLAQVRPIETTNPYEPPPKQAPVLKPAPPKRPVDRLGF